MLRTETIFSYFKSERTVLAAVTLSGLAYNTGLLAAPYLQGILIDDVAGGQTLPRVLLTALLLAVSTGAVQCARAVKRFYVRRFANNVNAQMQNIVYANLVHRSEETLLASNVGSLMTKAVSDVDACVEGMRKFTTEVFDTGVFIVSYFVVLLVYDWKLTLVSCAFIPAAFFTADRLRKKITGFTASWRSSLSRVTDSTYDYVNNAALYRITGREQDNCTSYERLNQEYEKKAVLANVWENSMMPVYKIISLAGIVLIIIFGAKKVNSGIWTVGRFTAYCTMFAFLADKASHAGKLFNSVQKAEVSWQRIKPFLHAVDTGPAEEKKVCCVPLSCGGTPVVCLDRVSFAWPGSSPVFRRVSFTLESGKILGITGPVACGKSTLARIFLGGLPYEGSVRICGTELSELSGTVRTELVSYMGHDASLLSTTIYENVTLGSGGSIDDVLAAVCFDTDLSAMPDGVMTLVGNGGVRLSGGQQERIALARTLYRPAPLIILDDPCASVARATERKILTNIRRTCSGSAVLIISHRLSQFSALDGVLLMEKDGECVTSTHSELMESSATYRTLYELQETGTPGANA